MQREYVSGAKMHQVPGNSNPISSQGYLKSRNNPRTSKKRYFLGNNKYNPSPSNANGKGISGSAGLKRLPSQKRHEYLNVYRSSALNRNPSNNGGY
jgi:hypothetical protein